MRRIGTGTICLLMGGTLALLASAGGFAADQTTGAKPETISPQAAEFFETRVRPVLFEKCFGCHGDKQQMGGLRLDSREKMLKGGSDGPVVVVGEPEKSALIRAIHYDGTIKMPPSGKLKPEEISALTDWIKMGAPWPAAKPTPGTAPTASGEYIITPERRSFWSFRPVRVPALPKVKDTAWVQSPIDRFILARLDAKGLKPAPLADRRTLIRRAYFDLIGLPPTPEEVDAFTADKSPNAFAKVVDRLLALPQYGERWGRHWLDVARYADTKGYVFTEDRVYHNAYTYRDYVIHAFNEDLPYDQFLIQQLAADHLPLGDDPRPLAALGFLTIGRRFLNDPVLINDDRIDVTCRGLMGLTVGCARCHDHKFDPIPTKDYYSLYGVFASSVEPSSPIPISPKAASMPYEEYHKKVMETEGQKADLVKAQMTLLRDKAAKSPDSLPMRVQTTLQRIRLRTPPNDKELQVLAPQFEPESQARLKALDETLADLQKKAPKAPEFAMALEELHTPFDPYVFIRGNPGNHGDAVPRRFLQILSVPDRKPFTQGSGRLELAQAIASKDNPLTARVLVNRVWLYHFGYGIVRTPSDFGTRGEPPTHPELLDWLAAKFVEQGWSIKKLHRLILLSSTYQMSSEGNDRDFAVDPENRLLSHQNRQRLDLEALRDSMLAVSGQLDSTMGGPAVDITQAPFSTRRTIYGFIERQNLPGLFRTFDFASPDTSSAQRYHTTIPQQALFMMNSPFVVEQAKALIDRPEVAEATDPTRRIQVLYRLLYGRVAAPDEIAFGLRFLHAVEEMHPTPPTSAKTAALAPPSSTAAPASSLTPWEQYAQTLLMTNEFTFVD